MSYEKEIELLTEEECKASNNFHRLFLKKMNEIIIAVNENNKVKDWD